MNEKFARGRSSEIFRLEDGRVLKLFFPDYPQEDAVREFKNTRIAYEQGCTDSKVYEMVEQDGRTGFIMDYIEGISQNDMPGKNPAYIFKGGKDLARCHVMVHSKESHELQDIRVMACELLETPEFNRFSAEEKAKLHDYIMALPESDTIIHLDFHTGNVLVDDEGNCHIIDWMTAARGNRAVEYAMMEFLFSDAELFPEASKAKNMLFGAIRGMIGKQYYKQYQELMPLPASEVDRYRVVALVIRRSWNIEFEKENLIKQIRALIR